MRKGIIEKTINSNELKFKDVFSIEGTKHFQSNNVSVLLVPDKKHWYSYGSGNTFTIKLKEGYGIFLTNYLLQSGDSNFPRNWCVEGLLNGQWTIIKNVVNDTKFDASFQKRTYNATEGFYTSFRFNQTAPNGGHLTFCLSFVDFFGFLSDGKGNYFYASYKKIHQLTCKRRQSQAYLSYSMILLLFSI